MATANPTAAPGTVAKSMNAANKGQISEALIIQTYANSIEQQPQVDFGTVPSLKSYQTSINDGLTQAKAHASNYLTVIQPEIIKNMSNIGNYYAIHDSVPTTLPPGSTLEKWNKVLHALQSDAQTFQRDANSTTNMLKTLHTALNQDVSSFATIVKDLNTAVNGDHGVLDSINGQLSSVQGKIDGAIAAVVISGLSVAGGVFMICVGSIADFVTAGTTTPLVVGGIGMVAGGVGGEIAASITLSNLIDQQGALLTKEARLESEVKLATGIQSGYASLFKKVKDAASASLKMELTWQTLAGDLGTMISDLNNGLMTADQIRTLFLTSASQDVQTVIKDINIIKAQMAGITELAAKKGNSVSQLITATAQGNQQPKPTLLMAEFTPQMLAVSKSNFITTIKRMNHMNIRHSLHFRNIENYALSVNYQLPVNFSSDPDLQKYEGEINSALKKARVHANKYLDVLQNKVLMNLENIQSYFILHESVASVSPAGINELIEGFQMMLKSSKIYKNDCEEVIQDLQKFSTNLESDCLHFEKIVQDLNHAVSDDKKNLTNLTQKLGRVQKEIQDANEAVITGSQEIISGVMECAVGIICEIPTLGFSTLLVIGGVISIVGGSEAMVKSAKHAQQLMDQMNKFLTEKHVLTAEVRVATALSMNFGGFGKHIKKVITNLNSMKVAWILLSSNIEEVITNLKSGVKNTDKFEEKILGRDVMKQVQFVLNDISNIKKCIIGAKNTPVKKGQTVGEAMVAATERLQPTTLFFKASPKVIILMSSASTATQAQRASNVTSERPISQFAKATLGEGRGTLYQSADNLQHAEDQVRSIGNLPGAAQRIVNESFTIISQMISQIDAMRGSVGNFVKSALSKLNEIEKMLKSSEVLEKIDPLIEVVRAESSSLDATANQVLPAIQELTSSMYGYFNQLSQVEVDLTNQMTGLQAKLGNAHSRESAAKKKYYYLIALGPFEIAGQAAALVLWNSIKSEVNGYENQIRSLNSQISSLNNMKTATKQLGTDFQDVISKVTLVKNAVTFVSKDILKVKSEIDTKEARIVIEVEVSAAIAEVKILSVDALGSVV